MVKYEDLQEAIKEGIISTGQLDKMIYDHFQKQIDQLKNLTDSYKKSVDKCYIEGVSSNAYFISSKLKELNASKKFLTKSQDEQISQLDLEYVTNFQRLQKGECQCTKRKSD